MNSRIWYACSMHLRGEYRVVASDDADRDVQRRLNDITHEATAMARSHGGAYVGAVRDLVVASCYLDVPAKDGRRGIGFVHIISGFAPEIAERLVTALQVGYDRAGGVAGFATSALQWSQDQGRMYVSQLTRTAVGDALELPGPMAPDRHTAPTRAAAKADPIKVSSIDQVAASAALPVPTKDLRVQKTVAIEVSLLRWSLAVLLALIVSQTLLVAALAYLVSRNLVTAQPGPSTVKHLPTVRSGPEVPAAIIPVSRFLHAPQVEPPRPLDGGRSAPSLDGGSR